MGNQFSGSPGDNLLETSYSELVSACAWVLMQCATCKVFLLSKKTKVIHRKNPPYYASLEKDGNEKM